MARPSILGNHPPTEAEVNHALECCKAIPHIREELLAMEQEMSDIKEAVLCDGDLPYLSCASASGSGSVPCDLLQHRIPVAELRDALPDSVARPH